MKDDKIISLFETIDFHDTGVSQLLFDFQNRTCSVTFKFWDDLANQETEMKLIFENVKKFYSDYHKDLSFNIVGCYSADCIKKSEKNYEIDFTFEIEDNGCAVPAWQVVIGFEDLKTQGGLSLEALAYKNREVQ